ncbi:dipeptide/tripeptide permease DtpA [Dongshaea marina]|uniref:dipeptide/tripeptide permease DtpA n=1 Tax=Dongshaea marina TaxID=2047966 RepID=UPI0019007C14|nr:dipeptide/tripeptide permease DtpA [Dongshaea marina]
MTHQSSHNSLNVFRQPKAFYMIFSVELWERFGFYGMQAILTLYMVHHLKLPETASFVLFGAFTALVYGGGSIGGWLGDKVLGTKRVILLGATTLGIGYLILAVASNSSFMVYLAMGVIAIGNCLFKANPSSLLSKLYTEDDPRLHGAFTMYYMSINIGAFVSMLITPVLASKFGWNAAFMLSFIGMMAAVLNFILCSGWTKAYGSAADFLPVNKSYLLLTIIGTVIASFIAAWLLQHLDFAHGILTIIAVIAVGIYFKEAFALKGTERAKMLVAFVLMLEAIIFWVLYNQMPMSLNFFAVHNVTRNIFGIAIEPAQFQSLNPFWIMLASPLLAMIYNVLGDKLPIATKFAIGMVLCSLAFLILPLGAHYANAQGMVSSYWVVLSYGLQSVGELMIAGLGLAMIAQLVPQRLMGFIMGIWMLTTAVASILAGYVAALTAAPKGITDPLQTLPIYSHVFLEIGVSTAVVALLMVMTAPMLTRVIQGSPRDKATAQALSS